MRKIFLAGVSTAAFLGPVLAQGGGIAVHPEREAYYGDLRLHTSHSFDAYVLLGTKVDPDAACRFARGEAVEVVRRQVQRREPLDFKRMPKNIALTEQQRGWSSPIWYTPNKS